MTDFPDLKIKALVNFPANVLDGVGVDVVKVNGNFQINIDFSDFVPPVTVISPADVPHTNALLWNSVTGVYTLTTITALTGTLPDAPSDGSTYGRKVNAWTPVLPLSGGTMTGLAGFPLGATALTPAAGDNSSNVATTAFVAANVADALAYSGMQINGAMDVSQEKGLTASSTTGNSIVDGWLLGFTLSGGGAVSAQQVVSSAQILQWGFSNTIAMSVTSPQASLTGSDSVQVVHRIEGYRSSRLAWGTSKAQPITVGFWTAHHRTGVYSVSFRNSANDRSYATTYTQAAADTWQYNVVTIPGCTDSTWLTNNAIGISVLFCLAAGPTVTVPSANTNTWVSGFYVAAPGIATSLAASDFFRITGVVVLPGIEAPSAARSALIMRPFDQELLTCQRYYQKTYPYADAPGKNYGTFGGGGAFLLYNYVASTYAGTNWFFQAKCNSPTVKIYSPFTGAVGNMRLQGGAIDVAAIAANAINTQAVLGVNGVSVPAGDILWMHATADARL